MLDNIKFDCKYFRATIPCRFNKIDGSECEACNHYTVISKQILIIKLGAMGDVIRTTPLIEKYRNLYPNCQISWLTQFPDVLPKDKIDKIYKYDGISFYTLSNLKFDIAVNLDKEEEACLLLKNVEAIEKYGFTWINNHIAATSPAVEHKLITGFFDRQSKSNTKHYIEEIFDICNLKFNDEPCLLNYNHEKAEEWKIALKTKAEGKMIVGLNTGCGGRWTTRLWSENSWIELIKLLQSYHFFPMVLGGEQENEKNVFLSQQTSCFYPGHFPLEDFFAITSACNIIVTQVSMMMHIAIALQKKIILMNNIFNKHEFYLYNRGVIVQPTSGCDCYYGNTCTRNESCMNDITAETIFNEIKKISL
jgi:heptosyltransferase-2